MSTNPVRAFLRPRRPRNRLARATRYLGLFAWVGGGLLQTMAVNRAGGAFADQASHQDFAAAVRRRWAPVEAVAVTAHVTGSAALGWAGRHRAWFQRGMPTAMVLDTAATTAAVAAMVARNRLLSARSATGGGGATDHSAAAAETVMPLLAAGSVAAQGYLAEHQRPWPTLTELRGRPSRA